MTQSKFQLVGSLLRPADLLDYKNKIEHRDDIQYPFYDSFPGYRETETAQIKKVIADEKANGIDILTDGEYSKSMWHLDFIWGLKGIERYIADHGYTFKDHDGGQYETRKDIGIRITQPLSGKNHHFLDSYKLLKEEAGDTQTKLTIWGPAHAYTELTIFDKLAGEGQVYKTNDELKAGLIKAYKEFLTEYKEVGGAIIQFDDCLWELFDESNPASFLLMAMLRQLTQRMNLLLLTMRLLITGIKQDSKFGHITVAEIMKAVLPQAELMKRLRKNSCVINTMTASSQNGTVTSQVI